MDLSMERTIKEATKNLITVLEHTNKKLDKLIDILENNNKTKLTDEQYQKENSETNKLFDNKENNNDTHTV